jgi:hypothetical protein
MDAQVSRLTTAVEQRTLHPVAQRRHRFDIDDELELFDVAHEPGKHR